MTTERTLYSVSDLISKTRAMLELSFKDIWLEGEVSNVHYHSSGHLTSVEVAAIEDVLHVLAR